MVKGEGRERVKRERRDTRVELGLGLSSNRIRGLTACRISSSYVSALHVLVIQVVAAVCIAYYIIEQLPDTEIISGCHAMSPRFAMILCRRQNSSTCTIQHFSKLSNALMPTCISKRISKRDQA